MTPEQQLQQLLIEAEQVTAKMREALAKMETPAQWTPKKGDWAEVTMDGLCYKKGDIVQINQDNSNAPSCIFENGDTWSVRISNLRHLPDYQPKPKLATTYDEVVEAVKPLWVCDVYGSIIKYTTPDHYQLHTEQAAKQDRSFIQIKNLEAYCADMFVGERNCIVDITENGELVCYASEYGLIKVAYNAGEWLIAKHPEPFLVFFGVN